MIKELKKENGITLIALVITIIILLILAGVTISALSGENGILTRAVEAKENTEKAQIIEETQIAVLNSYGTSGEISFEKLKENLKKINNVKTESIPEIEPEHGIKETIFPLIFKVSDYEVQIIDENRINIFLDKYDLYKSIQIKGYTADSMTYAYFNTKYIPNKDTGIEIKANRTRSTNANSMLVGSSSQTIGNQMDFMLGINSYSKAMYCFGNGGNMEKFKVIDEIGTIDSSEFINFYMDKDICQIKKDEDNNVYTIENESFKETNTDFNIRIPILIGGENVSEGEGIDEEKVNTAYSQVTKEFEYIRIYEKGVLLKNYIPAKRKSDDAIGFLETIDEDFLEKKGDGQVILLSE